jgi:hypothetical protein
MCNTQCTGPSLDELFRDTAVQLLMRRDGVTESDIRALLGRVGNARASIPDCTVSEDDASTGTDPAAPDLGLRDMCFRSQRATEVRLTVLGFTRRSPATG